MGDYLICVEAKDGAPAMPSAPTRCVICKTDLWVSWTLSKHVATGEMDPVCEPCLIGVRDSGGIKEARIHPAQKQELSDAGVLGFAEAHVRHLNKEHLRDN